MSPVVELSWAQALTWSDIVVEPNPQEKQQSSIRERLKLVQILNALPSPQFEQLVFALNPPKGNVPPSSASQGSRASDLLAWAESSIGPGLSAIEELIEELFGPILREAELPTAQAAKTLTLYRYKRTNKGYVEDLGAGVTLTLMRIPAGEFLMGAPKEKSDSQDNERPQHLVKVPQFFMGRYPVTQAQWRVVAGYKPVKRELDPEPSHFKGDDLPVESISWNDAQEFCKRLSEKFKKAYRLPSEAEWEYACRAETQTAYHFGDKITTELANYSGQAVTAGGQAVTVGGQVVTASGGIGQTTPVGQYPANRWGLHDMHGNVWEWCEDDYQESHQNTPKDGSAWVEGERSNATRVLRGGSWNRFPGDCRSLSRINDFPNDHFNVIGFRVCCTASRRQATAPKPL